MTGAPASRSAALVLAVIILSIQGLLYLASRRSAWRPTGAVVVVTAALAALMLPWTSWRAMAIDGGPALVTTCGALVLAWKYATRDFSLVADTTLGSLSVRFIGYPDRALLLGLAVLVWASPAFAIPFLLLARRFQPVHLHELLPVFLLIGAAAVGLVGGAVAVVGWLGASARGQAELALASHFVLFASIPLLYVVRGISKLYAGERWYDWMWNNPLHLQIPAAYTWGWGSGMALRTLGGLTRRARALDRPAAIATVALEVGMVLFFLHPTVAIALACGMVGFHVGYFLVSGALFWEYMIVNAVAAVAIGLLPSSLTQLLFGWPSTILFVGVASATLLAFWPPYWLAWWETPLTQRVYWEVEGESGRTYALSHAFMDPWESYFYFGDHALVPYRMLTQNLSHTAIGPHAQALARRLAEGGPAAVRELAAGGTVDVHRLRQAEALVTQYFAAWRAGARKYVLPRWLRWAKAPGCFLARGGAEPVFRGQEPPRQVRIRYRETFWTGATLETLRDEIHHRIDLPGERHA